MSTHDDVSRRDFLQRLSALGLAGVGGSALLTGCGGGDDSSSSDGGSATTASDTCNDLSGLTDEEKSRREGQVNALNYVSETPREGQRCNNCQFWKPDAYESPCGGCQLFPGPVNAQGYCTGWIAG